MTLNDIEKLVDLVVASQVSAITVERPGSLLTVRKWPDRAEPIATSYVIPDELPSTELEPALETGPLPQQTIEQAHWITSPMVGVFHAAEPALAAGMSIESGQIVGAIESMKLMNDIRAEESGIVREVAIEAGHAVEYGQPLFSIESVKR